MSKQFYRCCECQYSNQIGDDRYICLKDNHIIKRPLGRMLCSQPKSLLNMKDQLKSWKFWTLFGIIAAIIIAAVVCHLVQPKVTYAWLEIVAGFTFLLGTAAGIVGTLKWQESHK